MIKGEFGWSKYVSNFRLYYSTAYLFRTFMTKIKNVFI